MRGIPQRTDGGSQFTFEGGSNWSSPLYACASTVKASLKTISFLMNGTSPNLSSLTVTDVHDNEYPDNSSMPLWGVEDSGLALDGISPVWGLISPEYASFPNISTVRQPSFYLIGTSDPEVFTVLSTLADGSFENMPGSDFAPWTMNSVYSDDFMDYSGATSLAMFKRWLDLSKTPELAASIINLIWTDMAAQGVVGTKGVLGSGNAGLPNETVSITVSPMVHKIKYSYPYGIPAFIFTGILLVIILLAVFSATRQPGLTTMGERLRQSSIGRILIIAFGHDGSNLEMSSKEWSRTSGMREVDLSKASQDLQVPNAVNGGEHNGGEHTAVVENLQPASQSLSTEVRLKSGARRLTI